MLDFISKIQAVSNAELEKKAIEHLNDLTKPQGSLGRLESLPCNIVYAEELPMRQLNK